MNPDRCLALPPAVLERTDLSTAAKLVATALNDCFARFDPCTWVGNRRLARAIGRSVGHARRALAELVLCGLVGREMTDQTPTGRRLWLLWREQAVDLFTGAQPPCPPARTYRSTALTDKALRDVTGLENTDPRKDTQEPPPQAPAARPAVAPAPACGPAVGRPAALPPVPPIPAAIQALRRGASPEARAELVNRIAHRLGEKQPATYGFLRKWVNAAADGVGGAVEALAHGYAKAEAAILGNHPCPGRILVRRVMDFLYRPPAASRIGAREPQAAAPPVSPPAAGPEPAGPAPTVAQVTELESQVRLGDRGLRRLRRQHLVRLSEGGPGVPPEVQSSAAEALGRLGAAAS